MLNAFISRLPPSIDRVMCTNEDEEDIFACLAVCGEDGTLNTRQVCLRVLHFQNDVVAECLLDMPI